LKKERNLNFGFSISMNPDQISVRRDSRVTKDLLFHKSVLSLFGGVDPRMRTGEMVKI
jgi:predicted aconitase with swiveling domain